MCPSPFWVKGKINQSGCWFKPWQHISTTLLHLHWLTVQSQLQNPLSQLKIPSEPLQSSWPTHPVPEPPGLWHRPALRSPHRTQRSSQHRAVRVAAPTFWTALPASSLDTFKMLLEHHLFTTSYHLHWLCFPSRHSVLWTVSICLFACLCSTYSPVSPERRFINQSYNYNYCQNDIKINTHALQ